jgi:hypothetical protein
VCTYLSMYDISVFILNYLASALFFVCLGSNYKLLPTQAMDHLPQAKDVTYLENILETAR